MRVNMSPAVKHVTRVLQHPSTVTAIILKHRAIAFAITATLLVTVASALMLAKNSNGAQAVHNDAVTGTTQPSLDTKVTDEQADTQPVADGGTTVSNESNSGTNTSQSSTNVTVNNQAIDVPQNGSVHKTIQSDNSTTTIDVSSSSSSSSDTSGTSKSSSVNVNSVSGNVNTNPHVNVNRYLP